MILCLRACVWCLSMSSDHLSCIKAQRCLLVLTKWWNSGINQGFRNLSSLHLTHIRQQGWGKRPTHSTCCAFSCVGGNEKLPCFRGGKIRLMTWMCGRCDREQHFYQALFIWGKKKKVPTFYPKDGQKECITSGAAITASSYPFLISYYTQRGREETGEEMRGQEPSMIRQLFHWDHTVMGEAN